MRSLSVGRFPHGLLLFLFLVVSGVDANAAAPVTPDSSVLSSCVGAQTAFPTIAIDCTHRLQYLGAYNAEGRFDPLSTKRGWYNQNPDQDRFSQNGTPLQRPPEVPPFVNLHSQERVIENFAGRAHAVQPVRGQSRLAAWRDHIITFAYGHQQVLLAPHHVVIDSKGRVLISDPLVPGVHVIDGNSSFRIAGGDRRHLLVPDGIAVDAADNIYVADPEHAVIEVYDSGGRFLREFGRLDSEETLFERPTAIAISREAGLLYLLDTPRNVMLILDLQGHILKRVGRRSTDVVPVEFNYPSEITVAGGSVMVLDSAGARLQVFDLEGTLIHQFKTYVSRPAMPSSWRAEMGLAADEKGNVYLTNVPNAGVLVFNPDGKLLNSFGHAGDREGILNAPSGASVSANRLFIADTANRRVAVFEITSLDSEPTADLPGNR